MKSLLQTTYTLERKLSSLIKLEQVYKRYETHTVPFTALHDIHLRIARGEMIAVVGASGSGKSTLMNIIGFLDRATAGQYFFNNKNVSSLTDNELAEIRNQKIGFVFQSFFLLTRLNTLQNVMLPLMYRGLEQHTAKQAAMTMLEKMDISSFAMHYP